MSSRFEFDGPAPRDPLYSALLVLAADLIGLGLTLWVLLKAITIGRYAAHGHLPWWPLLILFLAMFWLCGAYPGISVHPVDEIKRIVLANVSAFLGICTMLALHRSSFALQGVCILTCLASSIAIISMRVLARYVGSRFAWWGYPVLVFATEPVAVSLLHKLRSQPHLGMRPVAVIGNRTSDGLANWDVEDLRPIAERGVRHVIVAEESLASSEFAGIMHQLTFHFRNVILIPDNRFLWKAGAHIRDLTGIPGLEVRNNLLDRGSQLTKRLLDLVITSLLLIVLSPGMLLIAVLIVAESGFPIFYSQKRLGRHGHSFSMYKFRTMRRNAAEVLEQHLARDIRLRTEWAENFKLRHDPRITRVGRLLRQTSLDELPQLWNVLRRDMSIVGPRPIVHAEVALYREAFSLYSRTLPGLTGLWQVSGRSRTTYAERVAYDSFYVRNWSLWMDLYLLGRTVVAVFSGDGAY